MSRLFGSWLVYGHIIADSHGFHQNPPAQGSVGFFEKRLEEQRRGTKRMQMQKYEFDIFLTKKPASVSHRAVWAGLI
jgi:hypothetical protein